MERYAKLLTKDTNKNAHLKKKLVESFEESEPALAALNPANLEQAVVSMNVRQTLNSALRLRREKASDYLVAVSEVKEKGELSEDDFGDQYHTSTSEPYFYDQSYKIHKHRNIAIKRTDKIEMVKCYDEMVKIPNKKCSNKSAKPIPINDKGKAVVAEELVVGKTDTKQDTVPSTDQKSGSKKRKRPKPWKCHAECKLLSNREKRKVLALKAEFERPIPQLRRALDQIDSGCPHLHFTTRKVVDWTLDEDEVKYPPLPGSETNSESDDSAPHDLFGHPLPCAQENSGCLSTLRLLRSAAPHYKRIRTLLRYVYEALRSHRVIASIDMALSTGDFEALSRIVRLHSKGENDGTADSGPIGSVSDTLVPPKIQGPGLPGPETYLRVQYAELIEDFEKKVADDPEFACCSCERLLLQKQVTAFKLSDKKFMSDMWNTLKDHICKNNPDADDQTHYVCAYCRVRLNRDELPCRCVLNYMEVEAVPLELEALDPLCKQMIQCAKAFQVLFRLGTYTGKVPSHTAVKACRGIMFFLPLPLDKTMDTVEEVEKTRGKPTKLPDPKLYIIVNSKSKSKDTIWQSLVNIDKLKAAVRKLKATNWLYVDVDENSLDYASKNVVETVSDTTSTMLEKVSDEEVSSYQSFTIRQLNNKQTTLPNCDHYKLVDVREDALTNKLMFLDVLCFPTLYPTGKFGESHPRQEHISRSEFVKSRLMNKDGRFRKDDQYVFYLLWHKEMAELASGVYNVLKGTRRNPMPVREFVDQVSKNQEEVEANLSTVFQNMHGSNQYRYLRRSEVLCMVRKYGSLTLFLTLSCAEYDSLEISTYLKKVNNVSDSYPTGRLCTEDPVSVSRKFSQKFHDFFNTVILKGEALGKVTHYFYKEYQASGAPHYHILLWIDGAPIAGKDSDDLVLHWIQERITCRIPEESSDPELH